MKKFGLAAAFTAALLLSACAGSSAAKTDTAPVAGADTAASTGVSAPIRDASVWRDDGQGGAVHKETGTVCPATLGPVPLFEATSIPVSGGRKDGICQYKSDKLPLLVTTYIYPTEGRALQDEIEGVGLAMMQAMKATPIVSTSQDCADLLMQLEIVIDTAKITEDGSHQITMGDRFTCVIMEGGDGAFDTLGAVELRDGWFLKVRATEYREGKTSVATDLARLAHDYFLLNAPGEAKLMLGLLSDKSEL